MKRKFISWALLFSMVLFSWAALPAGAQNPGDIIANDEQGIPDSALYQVLLDYCDESGDGELSVSEAELLTILDISDSGVTSLKGLENCPNLTTLNAQSNQITSLSDLASCTNLTTLILSDNQIADASGLENLTSLQSLNLSRNQLTDLPDISGLTALTTLNVDDNYIVAEILKAKVPSAFANDTNWLKNNQLLLFVPSQSTLQQLLVGDILHLGVGSHDDTVSCEILSGDADILEDYVNYYGHHYFRASKTGTAQVKFIFTIEDPAVQITTDVMQLTVGGTSSVLDTVVITPTLPQRVKMGDDIQGYPLYHVANSPSADYNIVNPNSVLDHFACLHVGSEIGDTGDFDVYGSAANAINPGSLTIQPTVYYDYIERFMGDPFTITVEEPEIVTNAVSEVTVGTSQTITTSLTNTALKNRNVAEVKAFYQAPYVKENDDYTLDTDNPFTGGIADSSHQFNFAPQVEIIEGADLIDVSQADTSKTLATSHQISFKKTGTVKLKVTYQFIHNNWMPHQFTDGIDCFKSAYSPEKIITIQIVEPTNHAGGPGDQSGSGEQNTSGTANQAGTGANSENPQTGDAAPIIPLSLFAMTTLIFARLLGQKRKTR